MTINIVSCVVAYKNRLAIGKNNDLLLKLKGDQEFFKKITSESLCKFSKLHKNVVLMGRRTWFSIPQSKRPLNNRINLVLTNDKDLKKSSPYDVKKKIDKDLYFLDYDQFIQFYKKTNANVFVIGGSDIYKLFLSKDSIYPAQNVYITEVKNYKLNVEPDTFMEIPDYRYCLSGYSSRYETEKCNYRILLYKLKNEKTDEFNYLDLTKEILIKGNTKVDRTGVGTISYFGKMLRFDISNGTLPLFTTKRVPLKSIIEELLFFCRGDTDSNILNERGVKIWNGNSTREFLDKRNLHHYKIGVLGPIYSWQWRFFGGEYSQAFANTKKVDTTKIGGFDQLSHVEHLLKTDPFSRRILLSAWNPMDLNKMALPPCHHSIQFYVEEINNEKYLSILFNMRSTDTFLGLPFNIASYTILANIMAIKTGMKTKELVFVGGDVHLYKNHISQINEQLKRTPRPFPKIHLDKSLEYKDWSQMEYTDFELIGYFPHPTIKAIMAV